ncbi:hypothetical protein B0H19DRAFT_1146301 [Mycena capillaripes]|nr:hypothetical protein B0H19DRAFT_1146301 [Mycena capillaripes]
MGCMDTDTFFTGQGPGGQTLRVRAVCEKMQGFPVGESDSLERQCESPLPSVVSLPFPSLPFPSLPVPSLSPYHGLPCPLSNHSLLRSPYREVKKREYSSVRTCAHPQTKPLRLRHRLSSRSTAATAIPSGPAPATTAGPGRSCAGNGSSNATKTYRNGFHSSSPSNRNGSDCECRRDAPAAVPRREPQDAVRREPLGYPQRVSYEAPPPGRTGDASSFSPFSPGPNQQLHPGRQ